MACQLLLAFQLVPAPMYSGLSQARQACNSFTGSDEKHMTFAALGFLQQRHADMFTLTPCTDTMRSLFEPAQLNHLGVLNYIMDCSNEWR